MPQPHHLQDLLKDLQDQHDQLVEVLNLAIDDQVVAEIPQPGDQDPSLTELLQGYSRFVEDRIDSFIHANR